MAHRARAPNSVVTPKVKLSLASSPREEDGPSPLKPCQARVGSPQGLQPLPRAPPGPRLRVRAQRLLHLPGEPSVYIIPAQRRNLLS